jgi:hypothetical protein
MGTNLVFKIKMIRCKKDTRQCVLMTNRENKKPLKKNMLIIVKV